MAHVKIRNTSVSYDVDAKGKTQQVYYKGVRIDQCSPKDANNAALVLAETLRKALSRNVNTVTAEVNGVSRQIPRKLWDNLWAKHDAAFKAADKVFDAAFGRRGR